MNKLFVTAIFSFSFMAAEAQKPMNNIYQSDAYSLSKDKVTQGAFEAVALSSTMLHSNYQSPVNLDISPDLSFKFSINGKDNEMVSGKNHELSIIAVNGQFETPVIRFGQQLKAQKSLAKGVFLSPDTKFTIRLDMREVLAAFASKGFYTAYDGTKIYKADFKGVFVAGSISPLIWDFDNLSNHKELELKDTDSDGIYTVTLEMNKAQEKKTTASSWKLTKDVSAFPQYKSAVPMMDALYNLGLEEMENAVEPDSTFRTGKEWAGVWTRDISYSIILSMATLQPKVAQYSLLRKVKNNRVIQDTGTGGSWPVSSDRMIWAVAAWEVYKNTGDQSWLTKAYTIIKNSVEDDLKNVYDPQTGLVRGESSFLDWRDQTYPKWMQSADIYASENLGTNAVHYQTNQVLAQMAVLMKDQTAAKKYAGIAQQIRAGINTHLWIPEKGYYGQYLYGRQFKILSPRSEALGEALTVLFDIADQNRQKSVIEQTPVNSFGIPCIYPQIPNIPPYHNNAVWPFVQAYWSLAAAKTGNAEALIQSMSAIYRPAALFLTNKENFVATTGDFAGTQVNSSNMLWSLSGNISLIYKVLFGMDMQVNGLVFKPFVPEVLKGERTLTNFKYRKAVLDIKLSGYGNIIKSVTLDGKPLPQATIPVNLKGKHQVDIILADHKTEKSKTGETEDYFSVVVPLLKKEGALISWGKVEGAEHYQIIRNGKEVTQTSGLNYTPEQSGEYQVIAIDKNGVPSFASEPVLITDKKDVQTIVMETVAEKSTLPYQGYTANGFIEISKTKNKKVTIKVNIPETGTYAVDFRYANGNGPTNTENKCAVRTFKVDGLFAGTFVFPQRGKEEWSDWGFSNINSVKLKKGQHEFSLSFEDWNENMNGEINQAMLDYLRLIRIN
ncbi:glycogen debranching protein [Pedobacter lusitanus]|uniref:Glycogen debranching protein n=1 Tax=Pedobacter lusitanus TaxID=1503925 RepID=A0A0D0GPH4_9SPHI|nr:family 78 glycoside hydrolase catalytic domain [Pedobacter lusitanus]KIO76361.1 glycogen debranching protein [Pedobacter lusitanus]